MLENYMDLYEIYSNEIIAGAAILVLLIIYSMLKKAQAKRKANLDVEEIAPIITKDDTELVDITPPTPKPKTELKPDTIPKVEVQEEKQEEKLSGEEEGTFGVEENAKKETTQNKESTAPLARTKRVVPPHDKIKKDDFKEFAGQRILVAEDNLINQKVINGLLADSGIEITIADDGQDALDILEKDNNFNIILMDAHMPRVDGFEATRIIRSIPEYNHIIVVALSGDTAADDIKKMSEAGMEEHLEKPLRMDALYDILYAYARNRASDEHDISMITKDLDTEKGLSICGYDKEFYDEILTEFVATYATSHVAIRDMLNNRQMKEADKYLLDISGTTSNIGATNISEIALALKNAVNNPKERRYVDFYKQYALSLGQLLKDIKKYQS